MIILAGKYDSRQLGKEVKQFTVQMLIEERRTRHPAGR